jgi:hypothetical protein
VPPLAGALEEQCAARGVVGVLGRASAFVGVAVVELSEEHGVIPGGAEGGPTLPSAITLAGGSRNVAVQFSFCGINFRPFLDDGGLAAVPRRAVMLRAKAPFLRRQPGASMLVLRR